MKERKLRIFMILLLTLTMLGVIASACAPALEQPVPQFKQPVPQAKHSPPTTFPVISYFYGNPDSIVSGDKATLVWMVTGSDNVSMDQAIGAVSASDNLTVSPTSTTTYTLTAWSGSLSASRTDEIIVTAAAPPAVGPLPVINYFDSAPSVVTPGYIITLAWKTTRASTVTIDNGIGNVATTGRCGFMPTATTIVTLTATNSSGMSTAQVTAPVQKQGNTAAYMPQSTTLYTDITAAVGVPITILDNADRSEDYTWNVDYYDPTAVTLLSKSYDAFNLPHNGVNGQEQFVFQALKAGDTKIMISYFNVNDPKNARSTGYDFLVKPSY